MLHPPNLPRAPLPRSSPIATRPLLNIVPRYDVLELELVHGWREQPAPRSSAVWQLLWRTGPWPTATAAAATAATGSVCSPAHRLRSSSVAAAVYWIPRRATSPDRNAATAGTWWAAPASIHWLWPTSTAARLPDWRSSNARDSPAISATVSTAAAATPTATDGLPICSSSADVTAFGWFGTSSGRADEAATYGVQ